MAVVLAALAGLVVGALLGAFFAARVVGRGGTASHSVPEPAPAPNIAADTVPAPAPAPNIAADTVPEPAPARMGGPPQATAEPDPDLKPVLDATRGVVTELEQRYQGARAAGDSEPRKPRRPRRRA